MGKIDIAIYIILVVFLVFGFFKGFMKQVLSTANWILSVVLAFVLVKPVSALVMTTPFANSINTKIMEWISSKGEIFNIAFDATNSQTQLGNAIQTLGLPEFIANAIAGGVKIEPTDTNVTLAQVLAPSISNVVITIITFIALFILSLIIIKLIIKLLDVVFDSGILGLINKVLGAALGLVKAVLLICILMLLASVLSGVIPSINEFIVADLAGDGFSIGRIFYETNPLLKLIEGSFSFDNILENIELPW